MESITPLQFETLVRNVSERLNGNSVLTSTYGGLILADSLAIRISVIPFKQTGPRPKAWIHLELHARKETEANPADERNLYHIPVDVDALGDQHVNKIVEQFLSYIEDFCTRKRDDRFYVQGDPIGKPLDEYPVIFTEKPKENDERQL